MARLDPDNRIGTGGEDMLSRNFNWNLLLIGMSGRAGLNLGLSLAYNSLVWTRAGNQIAFDADNGFPTPGFRLGFPVIYGLHYNSQTGSYGYLVLMPSGGRAELRRIGSTNIYEAADSSYLQLIDNGGGSLLVRSTDGTQLSYSLTENGYRCTQVKDRNGNFLTVTNSQQGRILTVIDTLGRIFNFNYDANQNLISISQTRGNEQYTWVTFGYGDVTIQTNFAGLSMVGLHNGVMLPMLMQVGLPDGTYYKFSYTTWGQIYKISYYAADSNPQLDNHRLNYLSYNLPLNASTAQTDCPRFTQRKFSAENWLSGAEVTTTYSVPTFVNQLPNNPSDSGTFCQMQTPDGTYYNVYSHSSGWDEGLPILEDTWANNEQQVLSLQRRVTTTRTQDNPNVSYPLNPRISETNVADMAGNQRRISVSYSSFTLSCGTGCYLNYHLPYETKEYAANTTSVLRTTQTDYLLDFSYTSRRLFGLASQKRVYDTANGNALMSKIDYIYDDPGEFIVQQGTPIQHDAVNYGTNFVAGRGNLTRTRKWDVINTSQSVESKVGYNTTGLPIFTRDPMNHQSSISYADSFSDGINRNTYAYPTIVTNADNFSSSSQYIYDLGAVTRTEGPPPAGQSQGLVQLTTYDTVGRIDRITNAANGAYTRNVYPISSNIIQQFATVNDSQNETVSSKLLDGAGRVRATASEHPGSTGGYVGQYFIFDSLGRTIQQTNPTEIYGSWVPAGDDAAGWAWTVQSFDWKGRSRISTNQDGTTREASYSGCGCAGGEVVTISSEQLNEGKRRQRIYHDILGRVSKTEDLNWDQTVYRTTTNTYDARDQITRILVQQGTNGAGQETLMTYDGYGRLLTRRDPKQASGTVISYTYNSDDIVSTMTDARGVVTAYAYNNRHQTTSITYPTVPSGVTPTPASSFTYDAAGNRTSMTDGLGSVSYQYNQLSRLVSETRNFTGVGSFALSYTYNLAGQVATVTDPWNAQVGYVRNRIGKVTSVTGSGYAGVPLYASGLQYRAWGALKSMTYGNGTPLALGYNNRLQVTSYRLTSLDTANPWHMKIDYGYTADGLLRNSTDINDPTLDRAYRYDHVGRLVEAFTGSEARTWVQSGGQSIGTIVDGPYRQSHTYDVWNNMTNKWGRSFTPNSLTQTVNYTYHQTSGRNLSWSYDANGSMTSGDGITNSYDASESLRGVMSSGNPVGTFDYDGDGRKAKKHDTFSSNPVHTYYLHSSVLGETVAEIESVSGTRTIGFVYADGQMVATQWNGTVLWQHMDASKRSSRTTGAGGQSYGKEEVDPQAVKVDRPEQQHYSAGTGGGPKSPGGREARIASLLDLSRCDFSGMAIPCGAVAGLYEHIGEAHPTSQLFWYHGLWGGARSGQRFLYLHETDEFGLMDMLNLAEAQSEAETSLYADVDSKASPHSSSSTFNFVAASLIWNATTPQQSAPLNTKQQQKYKKARDKIVNNNLGDKLKAKCASLLALTGYSISQIIGAVNAQQAYSGPDSKNISALNAGIVPSVDPTLSGQALPAATIQATGSVSEFFRNFRGLRAVTAMYGANPNIVFYANSGLRPTTILHESLHSLTGLTDINLAGKLGLGNFSDFRQASSAISKALKDNGCT